MGQAVHIWGQEVCGNSVLSTVFCYEPKTPLKKIKSVSPGNGKGSTKANSN